MKIIKRYKAFDGIEFKDKTDCIKHEAIIKRTNEIISQLVDIPDDIGFSKGEGYIQQDENTFIKVRLDLLKEGQKLTKYDWIDQSIKDSNIHSNYANRLIREVSSPLHKGWYRISCIDEKFREWGQPFYSIHPEEGKQICLNVKFKNMDFKD